MWVGVATDVCIPPPPFSMRLPPLRTPMGASPFCHMCMGLRRPHLSTQSGNPERHMNGMPSSFLPRHRPRSRNQDSERRTPPPPLYSSPPVYAQLGMGTHGPTTLSPFSPFPHPRARAGRAKVQTTRFRAGYRQIQGYDNAVRCSALHFPRANLVGVNALVLANHVTPFPAIISRILLQASCAQLALAVGNGGMSIVFPHTG